MCLVLVICGLAAVVRSCHLIWRAILERISLESPPLISKCDLYTLQCEELAMATLEDVSTNVVGSSIEVLIPVLAKWAFDLGRLQSHLLSRLLQKLKSQIKVTV
jgi:hypothetical protein